MKIFIQPTTWLKKFTQEQSEIVLVMDDKATVKDCIVAVGIPLEEVGLCICNGNKVDLGAGLIDGDSIKIFPTIIGG